MANYALLHIVNLNDDSDTAIAVYFDGTEDEVLAHDWQSWIDNNLRFHAHILSIACMEGPLP